MASRVVIGDLRVQAVQRGGGRGRSFTIVWPDGAVHEAADRFLRGYDGSGTQRTYAYLLVDHLRWLEREALTPQAVSLQDLKRYMAALGAAWRGPYGQPWRAGRRPFGQSALSAAAACVKGFYLQQALLGVNTGLGSQLQLTRLPSRAASVPIPARSPKPTARSLPRSTASSPAAASSPQTPGAPPSSTFPSASSPAQATRPSPRAARYPPRPCSWRIFSSNTPRE